jgi:transcriptional regulator with XRE-family HTH domain
MTLKQVFIRNLKEFRKKEGISQMNLALSCDISPGYIGEIESGRKFPSPEMIEKIARVLRIEPYFFFKNMKNDSSVSDSEISGLPYKVKNEIKTKIKKQIKTQVKKQIKTQISTQINAQVNLSLNEIFSEINEILDNC